MANPTVTPKPLLQGVLLGTTVGAALYTAVSALGATILSLTICNLDTVARTVTVYFVASGESAADKNTIFRDFELKPKETIVDDTRRSLGVGDFIQAKSDAANKVSLRVDGAELS